MSDIRLFTVVLDFQGGTYIHQVDARSADDALRKWAREVDLKPIEGLSESHRLTLKEELESDPLDALDGVRSVWCTSATIGDEMALINVIDTAIH